MSEDEIMKGRALQFVYRLHDIVEELKAPLEARHADRLMCKRGCSACCVDALTVFAVEAERIRRDVGASLRGASPGPAGGCVFLSEEGACRIYQSRPYVCRTQGLPLRWVEEDAAGDVVEGRDICPLNEVPEEPLEAMPREDFWAIGPFEAKLSELQGAFEPQHPTRRVALRDLFAKLSDDASE